MKEAQITEQEFRHIEGLLYGYYEQPQQIQNIQKHIKLLEQQVNELEARIKNSKVDVDTYVNMGIDYSKDKVQTSFSGSYVENEMCRQVELLEKRKDRKKVQIEELKDRIQDINEANMIIGANINMLCEKDKELIEAKYKKLNGKNLRTYEILNKLYMSKSVFFTRRHELIANISNWFRFENKNVEEEK